MDLNDITPILVLILFALMFVMSYREKSDMVAYSLLFSVIACILVAITYNQTLDDILGFIFFEPLIYLLCINLVILIAEQQRIFQYMAVRIIFITRNRPRLLFYVLCSLAAIFSGFLEDVSVTLIFIPLVIQTCDLLKIHHTPYIIGVALSIVVGNLLTPFASSSNILISGYFNLNISWYLSQVFWLFLILLPILLIIIDFTLIRHKTLPEDAQTHLLFEILNPNYLIENKPRFIRNFIYIIIIFSSLMIISKPYLVVLIAVLIISLIEKENFAQSLKKLDWGMIFFIISIFLMVGCMASSGVLDYMADFIISIINNNIYLTILVIPIIFSLIGSFISKSMGIIIFTNILTILYNRNPSFQDYQTVLVVAIIIGIVLGGNMVPQASSHFIRTLNIAKEKRKTDFTYKVLLKFNVIFSLISILIGFLYLNLMILFS